MARKGQTPLHLEALSQSGEVRWEVAHVDVEALQVPLHPHQKDILIGISKIVGLQHIAVMPGKEAERLGHDARLVGATDQKNSAAGFGMRCLTRSHRFRKSRMISCEALAPDPPVKPLPGCVPEPHKYRPLMGVRYCAQSSRGRMVKSWSSANSPWKICPPVRP